MDPKHLTAVVVSAILGVILLVTVVAPIVTEGQSSVGPAVTLTNDSTFVLKEADSGDVLKNVRTTVDETRTDAWTFNNTAIVGPSSGGTNWTVGIMSDSVYLTINAPDNASAGSWLYMDGSGSYHYFGSVTVTFTDTEIQIDTGSDATSANVDYTWAYVICPYEEGEYIAPALGGTGYVSKATDVLLCGFYSTGELDTMYYYHNGQNYVSTDGYSMVTNVDLTLHEGTTDIYDATVSVTVADGTDSETFTPYRIFVPYEVTGHAASGSLYSMLGIIPIVVAIGIVLGVVSMAIVNRYD